MPATGARSEIGKIGQSLARSRPKPPRLQAADPARSSACSRWSAARSSVLVVLLYGLLRGGWLDAVLAGIALGMSMLPEEFPVVLTVFMAMGAWRISQARVLTRRAAAIETLGSATVLCTDKTGTLTENRMSIAELRLEDGCAFTVQAPRTDSRRRFASSCAPACSRARRSRSIRWRRRFMQLGTQRTHGDGTPNGGSLVRAYGAAARPAGDVAGLAGRCDGDLHRRRQGRAGGDCAASAASTPDELAALSKTAVDAMAAAGHARARRRPRARRRRATCRKTPQRLRLRAVSAWSASPIRCAPSVPAAVARMPSRPASAS